MKNKNWQKVLVVSLILSVFFAFKFFSLENFFDISFLKENRENILAIYQKSPIGFTIVYFITYILTTAFFIPVATGLSLIAGAILGTLKGTVLVSIASTIGATISFILARYLLRDFFQVKYSKQFEQINRGVSEEGAFYLFSLRLVPIFPFFVINILMGLTQMKLLTYFWVSQLAPLTTR